MTANRNYPRVNAAKLPEHVLRQLQAFVLDNPRFGPISEMSPGEAIDAWLMWEGIQGYTDRITEAIDAIRKAAIFVPKTPNGSIDTAALAEDAVNVAIAYAQSALGVETGDLAAEHFMEEFAVRQMKAYIEAEIEERRGC